jgi:hypothetical protein
MDAAIAADVAANDALYKSLEEVTRATEAAAQAQYAEDLRVRLLRAQGNDTQADALELQLKQQREREALIKQFGDSLDPATLALLDQVQAQEKLAASSNKVTQGFLNIDDGLKVMGARFNAINAVNAASTLDAVRNAQAQVGGVSIVPTSDALGSLHSLAIGQPGAPSDLSLLHSLAVGQPGSGTTDLAGAVKALVQALTPTTDDAGTPIAINVDGRELARVVVKNLQRKASATLGTTVGWSKVSAN